MNSAPLQKQALIALAVTVFAASPCFGETKNGVLQSSISKTINLPLLDGELSAGHVFDQERAFSKLTAPGAVADDDWRKIPTWMSESWLVDKDKITAPPEIKTTPEGEKLQIPILAFAVFPPMSYRLGHYLDATKQTWEYIVPPHWQEKDDGKYQHHILVFEQQVTDSSDEVYGISEKRIEFIVDSTKNKIVKILQHKREEKRYLTEPDPIYNHQNSRTEVCWDTYDEHGDLLRTLKSENFFKSPGRIEADSSLTLPDGRSLFKMFNDYLAKNGMSDRIAKVAESKDELRYFSTGQRDYSKQIHPIQAFSMPFQLGESPSRAQSFSVTTYKLASSNGHVNGTIEAQGTMEFTSFRIAELKESETAKNAKSKSMLDTGEYDTCERKIPAHSSAEMLTLLNSLVLHLSGSSKSLSIGPGQTTNLDFTDLPVDKLVAAGLLKPKAN